MTQLKFNAVDGTWTEVTPALATTKQQAYLDNLRRGIGLEKWNAAKTLLGITTSGTYNLTIREASKLIDLINFVTTGGPVDDNAL